MDTVTLVALATGGLLWVVLLERLVQDTRLGLRLAAVTAGFVIAFDPGVAFALFGFEVHFYDAAFGTLFVAGLARMLRSRRLSDAQVLLVVLFLLTLWSMYRGMPENGLATVVNEGRKYIRFIGAALYLAPMAIEDEEFREEFARTWIALACFIAGIAAMRWVANAAGLYGGIFANEDDLRTVDSGATFIIVQGALMAMTVPRTAPTWIRRAPAALLPTVLLLQHRTVWVVTLVALPILLLRNRDLTRRLAVGIVAATAVVIALTVTVFASADIEISEELEHSSTSSGTFEWRVEGWRILLFERDRTMDEAVFGDPFGTGWERKLGGQTWTVSPHNFYVESFLRIGAIGLASLLAIHITAFRRMRHHEWEDQLLGSEGLLILGVTQLIYYFPYAPDGEQSMVFGVLAAAATHRSLARRRATESATSLVHA